jgi:hypothetical protein
MKLQLKAFVATAQDPRETTGYLPPSRRYYKKNESVKLMDTPEINAFHSTQGISD